MSSLVEVTSEGATEFAEIIHELAKGIVFGVIVIILLAVYGLVWDAIEKAVA